MTIKNVRLPTTFKVKSEVAFTDDPNSAQKSVTVLKDSATAVQNAVLLGKILEINSIKNLSSYNVWCAIDFPSIISIFGRRGTGKSFTLGSFAEGLIGHGLDIRKGEENPAAILFDTLGHFWQMEYPPPTTDDAQRKSLTDWGLNPHGFDNVEIYVPAGYDKHEDDWNEFTIQYSDLSLDDWCGMLKVDRFDTPQGRLMAQVFDKVTSSGWQRGNWDADGNLASQTDETANADYNVDMLCQCALHDVETNDDRIGYKQDTIRALVSKLTAMGQWPVLQDTGTPLTELFRSGILSIIKLSGVDDSEKQMIAGIIIKKIFKARERVKEQEEFARIRNEEVPEGSLPWGWILIDEAHEYCPQSGITPSAEHIIRFAKKGRSLGLGLVTTTQQPSALSSRLSSQINMLICHALAFEQDIDEAKRRLLNLELDKITIKNKTYETTVTKKILRSLSVGQTLISSTDVNRTFIVAMRPRLAAHGGGHPVHEDDDQNNNE